MPIDIRELQRIMDQNIQSKQAIKKRDNIIILGTTQSGKTTMIQHLLGYNLTESLYCKTNSLIPMENLQNAHQSLFTAPFPCTRHVNAIKIPDGIYKKGVFQKHKSATICDTPSLVDSPCIES